MRMDIVGPSQLSDIGTALNAELALVSPTTGRMCASLAVAAFAALMLTPFVAIGVAAAAQGDVLTSVVENGPINPASAIMLAAVASLALCLLCWGLVRGLSCRRIVRRVSIADGCIQVQDKTGRGLHAWSEPVQAYLGLAHRVRTSLSGSRHEIWLVHGDQKKSFPLMIATILGETELAARAEQTGLKVVPFSTLRSRTRTSAAHHGAEMLTAGVVGLAGRVRRAILPSSLART
ncbi:MAG: hypothetical protein KDJ36_07360 [Hyphomicrobiaceae bacterium]|nr:hypothetical protein [Hyphomicrobiaceae bacterium]